MEVDNLMKSFNQSALQSELTSKPNGVNLTIKTKLNSENPNIRGSQTSSHAT